MSSRLYFAYGPNLDFNQMAARCPQCGIRWRRDARPDQALRHRRERRVRNRRLEGALADSATRPLGIQQTARMPPKDNFGDLLRA